MANQVLTRKQFVARLRADAAEQVEQMSLEQVREIATITTFPLGFSGAMLAALVEAAYKRISNTPE